MKALILKNDLTPGVLPETLVDALLPATSGYELILLPGDETGAELAVRLAAKTGGSAMTQVRALERSGAGLLVRRKVYSGHILAAVTLTRPPFFLSADRQVEDAAELIHGDMEGEEKTMSALTDAKPQLPDSCITPLPKASGLTDARIVIAVGRGIRSKANIQHAQELADALGAALGGSRPVIMNAWLPMQQQIGVSGSLIHPDLCIVLGASGAPAFFAGIEGARTIIAVNSDPDAPIMKKADACICGDWKDVVSALVTLLK